MPLSSGQIVVQRYKVVRTLGQGGYGAVYLVEDTRLVGRQVALKESFDNSPEAKQQFAIEAQILANVIHNALPRVSDSFVDPAGHLFLVMDYVEGNDLSDIIQRGNVPEQQAVTWMSEICEAVGFLHQLNPPIIHRDVKPHNIKIRSDGHAVLVDFGIAKLYNPKKQTARIAKAISSGFSPPEQYGGGTDPRSDVYALGATLYCAVTGSVPPEAINLLDGTAQLASPRQLNPRVSAMLEQIILRAMSLDSRQRFATGREMAQALQACLRGQSISIAPGVPSTPVGARCSKCGRLNRPGAKFCQSDGTLLAAAPYPVSAAPLPGARPAISPQMRFELGNAHARKKDYKRAVAEYAQAAQGGFEHVALYNNWANALIEMDRPNEAIPILQRALGRYSQDADLYSQLGWAYALSGQHAQAAVVLKRALSLDPSPETHFILGLVYQQLKDDARAISEIHKYLDAGQDSAFAHFMLAQCFFRSDQWSQAQTECQRTIQLDAQHPGAYMLLAAIHVRNKRHAEAIKAAQQSNASEPNALAYFFLGQAHVGLKKWNDALKAFKESARLDPKDPDPHLQMAVCYVELKRRADARAELERVLEIDPHHPVARDALRKI